MVTSPKQKQKSQTPSVIPADLTSYNIAMLLERGVGGDCAETRANRKKQKKRKRGKVSTRDDLEEFMASMERNEVEARLRTDGVLTVGDVEAALSKLIIDETFRKSSKWLGAPWRPVIKLAFARCQSGITPLSVCFRDQNSTLIFHRL